MSEISHADKSRLRLNWHIVLMTLSMFMTGASGMVVEYVLSTVSSNLNGTQIESFSLTIAIMLGMMGIGGYCQKFVPDENLIEKFVYLEIGLAVISAFAPIAVYAAFTFTPEHFQLVYYVFAMSIGFMVGFEIPFLTRANATYTKKLSDNLSIIFAADYIGAFIGALVWVYLLLPHLHLIQIGFVLASLNFIVAMATYLYFKKGRIASSSKLPLVVMSAVAIALVWGSQQVVPWSVIIEQKMYPSPIVDSERTRYQQLTLTHDPVAKDTRLYINGNTQFSSIDEIRYHEMLVHVPIAMLETMPTRALVLGGGDGLAVRELRKYPDMSVDLIELDADMFRWARTQETMVALNKGSFEGFEEYHMPDYRSVREALSVGVPLSRYRVFFTDASNYVNAFVQSRKAPEYDIVIIDLPDPYSLSINKMYTSQFYKRLQGLLKPKGVVVTQATSPFHAKPAYLTIGKTLSSGGYDTKPYWHNIPSFGEWGWWMGSTEPLVYRGLKVETEYVSDALARSSFVFGKGALDGESQVNTMMQPVLIDLYNNASWKVE